MAMSVQEIAQGQSVERGTVLLSPARHDLALVEGRLLLSAQLKVEGRLTTITRFLTSLAMDAGTRSVAVILSGLADDGSAALRAIKAAGGMTFAQSDAEWSDMPTNAIRTGTSTLCFQAATSGRLWLHWRDLSDPRRPDRDCP
jgi:two-component system, chemotaxis family, CheB/CheR fusion protein